MLGALFDLFESLVKINYNHGNLKLQNIFINKYQYTDNGLKLKLIISDPHLALMFEEPSKDSESIADIMHTLICGRPPVKQIDNERVLH